MFSFIVAEQPDQVFYIYSFCLTDFPVLTQALLIIVADEVACGGRSRQVQHLTTMADSGAIEVVARSSISRR